MTERWALSGDLALAFVVLACVLSALGLVLLGVELFRGRTKPGAVAIAISGALRARGLAPRDPPPRDDRVARHHRRLPRRRPLRRLPFDGSRRRRRPAARSASPPSTPSRSARPTSGSVYSASATRPSCSSRSPAASKSPKPPPSAPAPAAISAPRSRPSRKPPTSARALVVISDGRLDRPPAEGTAAATRAAMGALDVPVHTVAVASEAPRDASVRNVRIAGAAVAHQPLTLSAP